MSELRKPDITTRQGEELVDAAGKFGSSLVRLGTAVVSVPLSVLPAKTREDAVKATGDLFGAVGTLHLSLLKATVRGVETAASELNKAVGEAFPPATK
ncbi:MAG: hypothetical protein HGA45_25795, partial [Chloroflexales bacterium]|nr:hypothetical protein [Chloroflexales bacterium]